MMRSSYSRLTLLVSWLAGAAAGVVAFGLPLIYFGLSYQHEAAALATEAEINARLVTQVVNGNPEMWRFEGERLAELMARRPVAGTKEMRRIVDIRNTVIAQSAERLDRPVVTRSDTVMDSGTVVGRIEISRSLRPLVEKTGLLALLGLALGAGVFLAVRSFPLRTLRQTLRSLSAEQERAQVTLRSIGDAVITTDAEGRVVLINAVAESLTGWTQAEAEGRPLPEVFHIINERTRKPCQNPAERVLKEGGVVGLANHTALITREGRERVIADSGAPIRDEDGAILGVVLVFRDITDQRKVEEELLRAGKLESIGILAGGIAHDFNNILTAIMGSLSLAMAQTGPSHPTYRRLSDAERACNQARDLTYQLLAFSRGGKPVKKAVSIAELIQNASSLALAGSNVRSEIVVADDLSPIEADEGQIGQVINNLLINAFEAMPGGGVITVRAENVTVGGPHALPLADGKYVKISVQDQGIGIPKEYLTRIFDPYFTTKQKGSGLGLTICYSIVRNHDGHITAESESGKGTTVHVYLPASLREASPMRTARGEPVRGSGRILVMDDKAIVRETAAQILEDLGYQAAPASDGSEAIDLYRNAKQEGRPFDAVIMDLTIPGGMGGKEAVRRLMEMDPDVRAIVSSGYSDSPVMSDFRAYGFRGVVVKPYTIHEMGRVLRAVLTENA